MLHTLIALWAVLDLLLLGASVLCIVASTAWRQTDVLISLVFMPRHFNAALALGLLLAFTFLFSVPAVTSPVMKQTPLRLLVALLVVDTLFATGAGTCVWLYSLRQREAYAGRWVRFNDGWRTTLQNKWHCCGYWNATAPGLFVPFPAGNQSTTAFCAGIDERSSLGLPEGCIDHVLLYTDMTLGNAFSSIFGIVCITLALFLATACIINERQRLVRFRKIDRKRGRSTGVV